MDCNQLKTDSDEGSDETSSSQRSALPIYRIVPSRNAGGLVITLRRQRTAGSNDSSRMTSPDSSVSKIGGSGSCGMSYSPAPAGQSLNKKSADEQDSGLNEGRLGTDQEEMIHSCTSANMEGNPVIRHYEHSQKGWKFQANDDRDAGSDSKESKDDSSSSSTSSAETDISSSDEE